jgi:AraC-like DNA-binding protein
MDDYSKASWGELARNYSLKIRAYGKGQIYDFPPNWTNGWIAEMHPADGLFVASSWFTPSQDIIHTIDTIKPCMWILCIDSGDIVYTEQGKRTRHLEPFNHIIVNPQKKFKFTFTKDTHYCFTSVLVYDDFINSFIKDRKDAPKINIEDAKQWKSKNYNTPDTMLIMEQIRWSVRNADMPLLGFEGMVLHLLSCIIRNYPEIPKRRSARRHYVTWENEQKIYRVKVKLDEDILHPPDIQELCRIADMSESKLRLSFRNIYDKPLYEYIRTETMKRAMQLLGDDHLSIRDIAEICGYKNAAKFAAAFKEVHGLTPSEFRKSFNL